MQYGSNELRYAQPFADALVNDSAFRRWFLNRTRFAPHANDARLLNEEIMARRSKGTQTWWRSHWHGSCECPGCSGQETDLLAIFDSNGFRFAIHAEVKNPSDSFKETGNQAAAYSIRARCWSTPGKTPAKVLEHSDAITVLLFAEAKRSAFAPHLPHFDVLLTFEDIRHEFPHATALA